MTKPAGRQNEKWETQIRKGLLDLIILSYLRDREYYGYELISEIRDFISMDLSEGTIYPLLNRLKKEKLITSKWVEMDSGVPRKYYRATAAGQRAYDEMKASWRELNLSLEKLMKRR